MIKWFEGDDDLEKQGN